MTKWSPWNPDPRAERRVKDRVPVPSECPHCGSPVVVVNHSDVYGRNYGKWPWLYRCQSRECDSHVGMHPGTAIPLGVLANREIREARRRCKPAFEALWMGRSGFLTRGEAYHALADRLEIDVHQCHFAWFDAAQCERARRVCEYLMREHLAADCPMASLGGSL